ncbi:IS3 family transposase [Virgibacillus kekensis]|uniref:IS3 family transposase n=1 Tax=Virgibacillus kekensis TaxID=202261 RepID=A0ABV9DR01_9BACI
MKRWVRADFPITKTMQALGLARSHYYYYQTGAEARVVKKRGRPTPGFSRTVGGRKVPDEQIEEYLMEFHWDDELGGLGYRKWTLYLREQKHLVINKKKVYRLCKELGILKERRMKKTKHPRKLARNRLVTEPNQLWQVDIKYGTIEGSGEFFFLCSAIDVYDRSIVGYYCGPICRAKHIKDMLAKALIRRKVHFKEGELENKLIIRTDNGPQFVSDTFGDFCLHHKIYHERIPKKTPDMNAYIESFHSVLQRECFDRHEFELYEAAYYYIDNYIDFYNNRRYHGGIQDYTPTKYYLLTTKKALKTKEVSL